MYELEYICRNALVNDVKCIIYVDWKYCSTSIIEVYYIVEKLEIFDHLMLAIYFESFQSGAPRVQLSIIKITANIFRENI